MLLPAKAPCIAPPPPLQPTTRPTAIWMPQLQPNNVQVTVYKSRGSGGRAGGPLGARRYVTSRGNKVIQLVVQQLAAVPLVWLPPWSAQLPLPLLLPLWVHLHPLRRPRRWHLHLHRHLCLH